LIPFDGRRRTIELPASIRWETDLKKALKRREARDKPVLIFFHDPGLTDSRKMETLSYPDQKVIDLIEENVVPVKLPGDGGPWADKYMVKWTPTLITVNGEGKEHHRAVGFLPPEELIPAVLLGVGKVHFDADRIDKAEQYFDQIVEKYPRSESTAEAIYLKGICQYKSTHSAKPLKMAYERLQADYPASIWTKRAYPYRLL